MKHLKRFLLLVLGLMVVFVGLAIVVTTAFDDPSTIAAEVSVQAQEQGNRTSSTSAPEPASAVELILRFVLIVFGIGIFLLVSKQVYGRFGITDKDN